MPTLDEMRRMLQEGKFADKPEKPKKGVNDVTAEATVTIEPVKVPMAKLIPQPTDSDISPRMFNFRDYDKNSHKFWTFEWLDSCTINFKWGRIGTSGQSKVKEFSTHASARAHLIAKINEKLHKGYKANK